MLIFNHLTTTITEIEIYLARAKIPRKNIPKDLAKYKTLFDDVMKAMYNTKKALQAKSDDILNGKDWEQAYQDELAGHMRFKASDGMTMCQDFLTSVKWNVVRFAYEWKQNFALWEFKEFTRAHRIAYRRGERMHVMSGLSWNHQSRAKERDWTLPNAAVTLETALVESYRRDLLEVCPGAGRLREEMRKYLMSIANPFHLIEPHTGKDITQKDWDFPDMFPSFPNRVPQESTESSDASEPRPPPVKVYNPVEMTKALDEVKLDSMKGKEKTGFASIDGLMRNKFLWCTDERATPGTLETKAHDCIASLSHVSHPFIVRHDLHHERRLTWARNRLYTSTRNGRPTASQKLEKAESRLTQSR